MHVCQASRHLSRVVAVLSGGIADTLQRYAAIQQDPASATHLVGPRLPACPPRPWGPGDLLRSAPNSKHFGLKYMQSWSELSFIACRTHPKVVQLACDMHA